MTLPSTILNTLTSHLTGLDEDGVVRVPVQKAFPKSHPPEQDRSVQPRQSVQTKKVLPPLKEPELMPRKAVTPVTPAKPAPPPLRVLILNRHPDCQDSDPSPCRICLVTDAGEIEGGNRKLLNDMIHAIGFVMPEESTSFSDYENLVNLGTRILVMGNIALQQVSSAGMDLQIVRGMWQQSIHGKLISTFPPSYLHDNPPGKKAAWGDLQKILADLGRDLPEWTRARLKKK
jgi:hypothetical protein